MERRRTALLICNGDPPSRRLARHCAASAGRIVAADGGANRARPLGIVPSTIVGDLDSLTAETRRAFPHAVVIRIRRQDNTDLEKALDLLAAEGIRKILVVGVTGGRVDFAMANLISLWKYARRMEIVAAGDGWFALPASRPRSFRLPLHTSVSLIPLGPCREISLTGFVYPLRNGSMRTGEMGVSNRTCKPLSSVRVGRGAALLFIHRDLRETPGIWP